MFVYCYWPKNGYQVCQAFYNADQAAAYVIHQINSYVSNGVETKPPKKKAAVRVGGNLDDNPFIDLAINQPVIQQFDLAIGAIYSSAIKADSNSIELEKLKAHLDLSKKQITIDNANKAIEMYEDYAKHILHHETLIHSIQEMNVVE